MNRRRDELFLMPRRSGKTVFKISTFRPEYKLAKEYENVDEVSEKDMQQARELVLRRILNKLR